MRVKIPVDGFKTYLLEFHMPFLTLQPDDDDVQEDYNGTDGNGPEEGIVINASEPIWDARAYWLRVVDLRMRIIHKEWKYLVMNMELQVKAWMRAWESRNPLLWQTETLGNKQREQAEELLKQTLQTMILLRLMSKPLTLTVQAFARFDGDKSYFSDIDDDRVAATFDSLYETFDRLVVLQNKLESLQLSCDNTERIIQLLMVAIGNQLNSETQAHTHEANKVNLDTNKLFLVTTPFVLALQYFGAEKDIFSFERNPRTFSYAICILFCALPILTYCLSLLNQRWDDFSKRIFGKAEPGDDQNPTPV
ncbi:hypothetical protein E8E12_007033 [Didymella heteroderae]|uniref:Uncharacterized protein n=1 Tax=Didymella heteroderae TaxID=1769908 RepID=A0A9P5BXX9_9PLEO|nr:hypothetical protein E8E12_007033 [Didymella heteroderae]